MNPRRGDEGVQVMEWVYGVLSTLQPLADALDVTLDELPDRVWPDVAPTGTEGPWVVYAVRPPTDVLGIGAVPRLMAGVGLDVQVIGEVRTYEPLADAARAIYDAIHGALNRAVPAGGVVLTALRQGGIQYPEQAAGIEYRHLGHTFQVEVQ